MKDLEHVPGFGASKRRSKAHYRMMKKMAMAAMRPKEERFWGKVVKGLSDECWKWNGATVTQGRGVFRWNGRVILATRIVWEITNRPVPEGQCVLHRCDVPWCCNPAHLFIGTHTDNMRDMISKHRNNQPKGERHRDAKLSDRDVLEIRKSTLPTSLIAQRFGVSKSAVSHARSGRTWKHLPGAVRLGK